ncbi:MAG: hypothetical protein KA146_09940 [Leptospiraceae bacterium]|nr:hypothetical protein [Leptospiraceae bacterium]
MVTIEDFVNYTEYLFGTSFVKEENEILFFESKRNPLLTLPKSDLNALLDKYNSIEITKETEINTKNSLEILVSIEREDIMFLLKKSEDKYNFFSLEDDKNKIKYEIGFPTDIFIIHLIDSLNKKLIKQYFRLSPILFNSLEENSDFLAAIRNSMTFFKTIKVYSSSTETVERLQTLIHSFIFHLGYNLSLPIATTNSIDFNKIKKIMRTNISHIDPPRRLFNKDLVFLYQYALNTKNPVLQYLSFYHIFEYFYETVFNEDLINTVRNKITRPDFSFARDNDFSALISILTHKIRFRNDGDIKFNEREALKFTLHKFFTDFNKVKDELKFYDMDLIEYYKSNSISFSGGVKVDLDSNKTSDIVNKLVERIYKTRNAIVHKKEGADKVFLPFQNENELKMEIPLMRILSEEIILGSSQLIET